MSMAMVGVRPPYMTCRLCWHVYALHVYVYLCILSCFGEASDCSCTCFGGTSWSSRIPHLSVVIYVCTGQSLSSKSSRNPHQKGLPLCRTQTSLF